jgi:hypothetical protein
VLLSCRRLLPPRWQSLRPLVLVEGRLEAAVSQPLAVLITTVLLVVDRLATTQPLVLLVATVLLAPPAVAAAAAALSQEGRRSCLHRCRALRCSRRHLAPGMPTSR